ncbi:MAG: ABC transporter permease [Dehalococcoidia bacterium]|nr:ABC transporter permease [Dehalococcoidia bacterium]
MLMFARLAGHDSIAFGGSVIGLLSLLFGWLELKPNRLAAGTGLSMWQSAGWLATAIVIVLWLICLALSLSGGKALRAAVIGMAANLLLFANFAFAGLTASGLLREEAAFSRVSLGAGIWISVFAAYLLIFSARQKLKGSPLWRGVVSWSGLLAVALLLGLGWLNDVSVVQEFMGNQERFSQELVQHVLLFGGSVAAGSVLGVLLGIWAARSGIAEKPVFFAANVSQTLPSLAFFGLLIAPLSALSSAFPALREMGIRGIGATPAVLALTIYSLLPIVRNTYLGLRQVDPAVIDAGLGMGMSRGQVFRRIELPLSAPLVLEGIRTAMVQAVGNTAVAALIGAGGLGYFIFAGLGQAAFDLIMLGAIPIIVMALVADAAMRFAVKAASPKGTAVPGQ